VAGFSSVIASKRVILHCYLTLNLELDIPLRLRECPVLNIDKAPTYCLLTILSPEERSFYHESKETAMYRTSRDKTIELIVEQLKAYKDSFIEILTDIATYRSAEEEVEHSIQALLGAREELKTHNPPVIDRLVVYHPSNMILYSYILYGVIPSQFCKEILIRPSAQVADASLRLHELLNKGNDLPIKMLPLSQRQFTSQATDADVVVFTGAYRNSLQVQKAYPNALFLFFGSSINPFIVAPAAVITDAASKAVQSRIFNSGQDCLCPDVYFIHYSICNIFIEELLKNIQRLRIGSRKDNCAEVTPLYYALVAERAAHFLKNYSDRIIWGGKVDIPSRFVEPAVILSSLENAPEPEEFFCPIFNLVIYENAEDVLTCLQSDLYKESAMGVSVFGDFGLMDKLHQMHALVAHNDTLFNIENGNKPFGGYTRKASYVYFRGQFFSKPILISREVAWAYENAESVRTVVLEQ
jgi:aldehyde dehydrogenase (NAD+)